MSFHQKSHDVHLSSAGALPVLNANVTAYVETPSNGIIAVPLADNGIGNAVDSG